MAASSVGSGRRPSIVQEIEADPRHHLTGPFSNNVDILTPPVTPFDPKHSFNGFFHAMDAGAFFSRLASSIKGVAFPLIAWAAWELGSSAWRFSDNQWSNPFAPLIFISYPLEYNAGKGMKYQKGYKDLMFLAYYVVVWSLVRQTLITYLAKPFARWCGIRSSKKIDRFGEQAYALAYFTTFGIWGLLVMRELPTWWYRTHYFWIDYPHWQMNSSLKRYYLMQASYWLHLFLVLVLGLEKPRSDFLELAIHHVVTLWLIGWSYLINLTYIGTSIFVSMDVPDALLALAKLCNYTGTPNVVFPIFVVAWSYFRHFLNILILKSVWNEFHLMPESSKQWNPPTGAWMVGWMQYQVIVPIALLQLVNLFWYVLIWRILIRSIFSSAFDDERSDDEDDDSVVKPKGKQD